MNQTINIIKLMQLIAQVRRVYGWSPATNDALDVLVADVERECDAHGR